MNQSVRRLRVRHTTNYRYDHPIERSIHHLHLHPMDDWKQTVLDYHLSISPAAQVIDYDDVFGNWATRFELNEPYTELTITADSFVELLDTDSFAFANLPIRPQFPLMWMPSQRTMLHPYLVPVELPDTELQDIFEYAMSFVRRNNGDLMETLFGINLALFHDFEYSPGTTHGSTTPYEVMHRRKGVCQDFANLFITMARLLGIPARYVCGYIYTGNSGRTRATSDATHAWVQLYIPNIGWKAFDPTNGVLPRTDHIRVAYGRYFRDTSPTAGALYTDAAETMTIDVEVTESNRTTALAAG